MKSRQPRPQQQSHPRCSADALIRRPCPCLPGSINRHPSPQPKIRDLQQAPLQRLWSFLSALNVAMDPHRCVLAGKGRAEREVAVADVPPHYQVGVLAATHCALRCFAFVGSRSQKVDSCFPQPCRRAVRVRYSGPPEYRLHRTVVAMQY